MTKCISHRIAQLSLANYTRIKISVPGDPQLVAGSLVTFNAYAINPKTYADGGSNATRSLDPTISGNYLITAVRHIVKINAYITVLELARDSSSAPSPGYNSSTQKSLSNGNQL